MIGAEPLPDRPGPGVDAEEWSFHHRLFYALVLGAAGSTTEELQLLYVAVAPVAYQGLTVSPAESRRWRRKMLEDLRDEGVVSQHKTPRGWIWIPTADVVDDELPGQELPSR